MNERRVPMAIFDIIMKFDNSCRLLDVNVITGDKNKDTDVNVFDLVGANAGFIFGSCDLSEEGFVEFNNKVYKYQKINGEKGFSIFLSSSAVLTHLYEAALDHCNEGTQIFDKNGYFLYGNPASEKLEYYKKEDFVGKHILDIYEYNSQDDFSTVLTVLRTKNKVENRCDRFKIKTGKILTTINTGYPVFINKEVCGVIAFETDSSLAEQTRNRMNNLEDYMKNSKHKNRSELYCFEDIVHQSDKMKDTVHFAKKVSMFDSNVLIEGATGTGKELFAQSIHSYSSRRNKPFVDINCSAIPSNLFESMFFGTEKGSFTGSITKQGFFEMAEGGSIFLDEVNSISLDMQAKLLRVLQEKRFQRVGGSRYIECNVRILVAANEDLHQLMLEQKIRKDFYYRISAVKVQIPSLQDRKEDIPLLVKLFVSDLCKKYSRQPMSIDEKAINLLENADWPGNVRELQNSIEFAFNRAPNDSEVLEYNHLPDYIKDTSFRTFKQNETDEVEQTIKSFDGKMIAYEREILLKTLQENDWNITRSAKLLNMSRQNLQYRIRKLEIKA
jgi:arginine utilization regulatory protein